MDTVRIDISALILCQKPWFTGFLAFFRSIAAFEYVKKCAVRPYDPAFFHTRAERLPAGGYKFQRVHFSTQGVQTVKKKRSKCIDKLMLLVYSKTNGICFWEVYYAASGTEQGKHRGGIHPAHRR
jgi:hypothetical protein